MALRSEGQAWQCHWLWAFMGPRLLHGLGVRPQIPQAKLVRKATNWRLAASTSLKAGFVWLLPQTLFFLSLNFKLEDFTQKSWISAYLGKRKTLSKSGKAEAASHMVNGPGWVAASPHPQSSLLFPTLKPALVPPAIHSVFFIVETRATWN